MVLKQEGVREISKGIKKFQGFRDENCGILQSTSSGGRELKGSIPSISPYLFIVDLLERS